MCPQRAAIPRNGMEFYIERIHAASTNEGRFWDNVADMPKAVDRDCARCKSSGGSLCLNMHIKLKQLLRYY
jgi:hypothetical protein